MTEPDFRNRRARHIVYGHTRSPESLPLEASFADGFVLHQTYFNLGAWSRAWRATQWTAADGELAACDTLSLLALYEGDERGGRPYEMWTGALGAPLNETPAPHERPAAAPAATAGRPSFTAHEAHARQPHFPAIGAAQPIGRYRR